MQGQYSEQNYLNTHANQNKKTLWNVNYLLLGIMLTMGTAGRKWLNWEGKDTSRERCRLASDGGRTHTRASDEWTRDRRRLLLEVKKHKILFFIIWIIFVYHKRTSRSKLISDGKILHVSTEMFYFNISKANRCLRVLLCLSPVFWNDFVRVVS